MAINDAPGGHRLRRRQGRQGVADGGRRHQQRRDPGRARRPARSSERGRGLMTRHTLSVLVENKPGVLARVSALFSRRGFNIDSLAVGPTENPDVSRMTIVVDAEAAPLEQVTKQLNKLINVSRSSSWTAAPRCSASCCWSRCARRLAERDPGAADRRAVPGPGRRRHPGHGDPRGHRHPRQAGGAARDPRAARDQGDGAVRHGRPRPRPALDHAAPVPCARSSAPPEHRPTAPTESTNRKEHHQHGRRDLLRRRRRPVDHPGAQGRRHRLRQPGPRPRAVACATRASTSASACRRARRAGRRPRTRACGWSRRPRRPPRPT